MATRHLLFSILFVTLGIFIGSAQGEHFEFGEGDQTCILLDIDATFDLSMGEQKADPFSLEGANTTVSSSLCGAETRTALLSLSLFPSNEALKITFRRETSIQTVSMSVVLNLDPSKHFENASGILPFELEDSNDLPIGATNMSYKCDTEQKMEFNQDPGYAMTMKITNLQVQAYDIENGQFSQAIVCDQDLITTVPTTSSSPGPTTQEVTTMSTNPTQTTVPDTTKGTTSIETPATIEPETTTPPESSTSGPETPTPEPETTTPEPETITPEPVTTTPEPVPTSTLKPVPKYEVKDGNIVCIAVRGEIKFNINYKRNDSQKGEVSILVPKDAKVAGQCNYNGTNTTQQFKVTFFDDKWSFSALISEDVETLLQNSGPLLRDLQAASSYSWKEVEITYVVDERFEDPKESDIGKTKTAKKEETEGIFRASDPGSYKCNTGDTVELDEEISVDLGDFQYKAFGTDDSGDFNDNDVSACPKDSGDDDDDSDTVAIVLGSVFGGLAFIILVGVIGMCLRKRKKNDYEVM